MALMDLTDQRLDHPGIQKSSARQVLDEMPEWFLVDFAADSSWKWCPSACTCQERCNGDSGRDGLLI